MGEIGPEAHHWLTVLHGLGQMTWEMLALGPTAGQNARQPLHSCFAGNPLLISFESLRIDGVLLPQDLALLPAFNNERVDYGPATEVRAAFLRLAAQRLLAQCESSPLLCHAFEAYCDREASWLDDWALFAALQHEHNDAPWHTWPSDIAARESEAVANAIIRLESEMDEHRALQFLFTRQWHKLRAHAHELGIQLVAEMPLVPAAESADAWAAPQLFSADGRCDWTAHEASDYAWWRGRVGHALRYVDALRLSELPTDATAAGIPLGDLLAALKASAGASLPVCAGSLGHALPPSRALHELLTLRPGHLENPPSTWRFTWEQITPEIEARLAHDTATEQQVAQKR